MKKNNRPKNRKTIYSLLIIFLALAIGNYSCSGTKKTNDKNVINQTVTELTTTFNVSAKTRLLINDIQDELNQQKINIKEYSPTKNIIEKYDILKIEGTYYISGMIMVKKNFNRLTLDDISVKMGSQSGKFTTVQIPVNNFDSFLHNEGLEYFQVAEKTKTN